MVQISEDVGNYEAEKGSAVLVGLHPGIRRPDLPECGRPRPEAQLGPSHGLRVPVQSLPRGTPALSRAKYTPSPKSARPSDEDAGGKDLC